jgi:hypothetical protein
VILLKKSPLQGYPGKSVAEHRRTGSATADFVGPKWQCEELNRLGPYQPTVAIIFRQSDASIHWQPLAIRAAQNRTLRGFRLRRPRKERNAKREAGGDESAGYDDAALGGRPDHAIADAGKQVTDSIAGGSRGGFHRDDERNHAGQPFKDMATGILQSIGQIILKLLTRRFWRW